MMDKGAKLYEKIWILDLFHSFPHVNKQLEKVSSEFEPDDSEYRESLIFWALIPVAFCILLWLFYSIYFICRCCEKQVKLKKKASLCPRVTTGLCIFFVLGLLSFGLYENEEADRGVSVYRNNLVQINTTIGDAVQRINNLDAMEKDINDRLTDDVLQAVAKLSNDTVEKIVKDLIEKIETQTQSAATHFDKLDLTDEFDSVDNVVSVTKDVEYYRWLGSVAVHCLFILILFITLVGLLIRSKALLLMSTVICVLCSLFLWAFVGAHFGSSVGIADLCTDPNKYVINLADTKPEKAVLTAYVECSNNTEPYGEEIQTAIKNINQALTVFDEITTALKPFALKELTEPLTEMKLELQYSSNNLSILLDSVGICDTLHSYYEHALQGICVQTITATAWLTATGCLVGVFCVIIVISNSMLWRQYAKKRHRGHHDQVDDTDPFLPRPPPYDSDYGAVGYSSPTPWSERGTLQQQTNRLESPYSDESLMMLPPQSQRNVAPLPVDESPPPAYHPGHFVRQYAASSAR